MRFYLTIGLLLLAAAAVPFLALVALVALVALLSLAFRSALRRLITLPLTLWFSLIHAATTQQNATAYPIDDPTLTRFFALLLFVLFLGVALVRLCGSWKERTRTAIGVDPGRFLPLPPPHKCPDEQPERDPLSRLLALAFFTFWAYFLISHGLISGAIYAILGFALTEALGLAVGVAIFGLLLGVLRLMIMAAKLVGAGLPFFLLPLLALLPLCAALWSIGAFHLWLIGRLVSRRCLPLPPTWPSAQAPTFFGPLLELAVLAMPLFVPPLAAATGSSRRCSSSGPLRPSPSA